MSLAVNVSWTWVVLDTEGGFENRSFNLPVSSFFFTLCELRQDIFFSVAAFTLYKAVLLQILTMKYLCLKVQRHI